MFRQPFITLMGDSQGNNVWAILNDPQGNNVWNTSSSVIAYDFMRDSGNFALKSKGDETVWQSFEHPTDILLPGQTMDIGEESAVVDSRLSETNFTKGRFQLRLQNDGNLVLNTRDLATNFAYNPYYASDTSTVTDPANPGYQVVYNESGYMYLLRKNGSRFPLLPQDKIVSYTDNYQRATLDFDGVLTWYYIPRASTGNGWSAIKLFPGNICLRTPTGGGDLATGPCGYNSICTLGGNQRPNCECPHNYSLLDPDDKYGSSKPDFIPDECQGNGQSKAKEDYELVQLVNRVAMAHHRRRNMQKPAFTELSSEDEAEDVQFKQAWLMYFCRRAVNHDLELDIAEERLHSWINHSTRASTSHDAVDVERGLIEIRKLGIETQLWEETRRWLEQDSQTRTQTDF